MSIQKNQLLAWIHYFILRLVRRVLELPLLIFYVLPIIEIVIYFQENQMEIVSEVILNTLFLGNLNFSADGTAHINGFRELGSATIGWLIIFELLSEVLEWMFKRRKKKFPGAKIASWSLAALYIGAGFSFAYTPHEGPLSDYIWIVVVLYSSGWLLLKLYQAAHLKS